VFKIKKLSLQDQVQELFRNAQIAQYTEIKRVLLPGSTNTAEDDKNLLNSISKVAVLIRGVWVIKTSFCRDMRTDRYSAIRNFLLMTFALETEFIRPKDLGTKILVDPKKIIDILEPFCDRVQGKGWCLKKPPDEHFIQQQQSTGGKFLALYQSTWEKTRPSIIEELSKANDIIERKEEDSKLSANRAPPRPSAKAGLSIAFAETKKPDEKELLEYVFQLLEKYGVIPLTQIFQKIQEEEKANKFKEIKKGSIDQDLVIRILAKCARSINGDYFLITTGDPETDKYREIVLKLFSKQHSITKKEIEDECINQLQSPIPAKIFTRLLRSLGYSKNNKWIFKGSPPK